MSKSSREPLNSVFLLEERSTALSVNEGNFVPTAGSVPLVLVAVPPSEIVAIGFEIVLSGKNTQSKLEI